MYNKNILFAIILFILTILIGISACESGSSKKHGEYYSKEEGFYISFPTGWKVEKEGNTITAFSPYTDEDDVFCEAISISTDNSYDYAINDYFEHNVAVMRREVYDFHEEERGETMINNVRAKWIVFTYSMPEGVVKVLGYSVIIGDRAYLITCDAEPQTFSDYRNVFEKAVKSMRFSY